jgi:alkanesulfonate monooxygenase SsuD/methylene tetrahydromethanopterin reductase-like flavin-dependent oxidoreductase (luciferase family)
MAKLRQFRFGSSMIPVQSGEELASFARKLEALGFSTLAMGEHLSVEGR